MTEPIKTGSNLLVDLTMAKALFQQRTIEMILRDGAPKSKPDQERKDSA